MGSDLLLNTTTDTLSPFRTDLSNESGMEGNDPSHPWPIVQGWAARVLHAKFDSAQELADHIVKYNLLHGDTGERGEETAAARDTKKIKDKRKVGWRGTIINYILAWTDHPVA